MNKKEIVRMTSKDNQMKIKLVENVVDIAIEEIIECLGAGEKVQLSGFGTFNLEKRNGRVGRNPKTGETINIPEKNFVTFRASGNLKKGLN